MVWRQVKFNKIPMPKMSPEFAYFLGLFWADGYIKKENSNTFSLETKEEDALKFFPILSSIGRMSAKVRHRNKQKPTVNISFSCKELKETAFSLGYQNKSFASASQVLDYIPNELEHYWWRGYLDGDGCFCARKQTVNPKNMYFSVSFTSSFDQDWSFLWRLPIGFYVYLRDRKNGRSSDATNTKREDVIKFGDYIYQGEWFGLERKRDKWAEAVNYKS
jgi:hypothetical protein